MQKCKERTLFGQGFLILNKGSEVSPQNTWCSQDYWLQDSSFTIYCILIHLGQEKQSN